MSRSCVHRQNRFGQLMRWSLAVAAVGCFFLPAIVSAQTKSKKVAADPDGNKKSGKIVAVENIKGKSFTLKIEELGGEKLDVNVSPKTKFVINGKGDATFFKHPRAFVSSDQVFTANQKLFGKKFTFHVGSGAPDETFERDPDKPEVYHIAGSIVESDEASFTVNAGGTPQMVNFEQGADLDVSVESSDPKHAAVGSTVEVEGTTRSGKFFPTAVVVTVDKPMVADDVFAGNEKKTAKTKSGTAGKTASKTAKKTAKTDKGDDEEMADKDEGTAKPDPFKTSADPFDTKKSKDTKKKTTAKPKVKKPPVDPDMDE